MNLKNVGIFLLLALILLFTAWKNPAFLADRNLQSLVRWTSLFGFCSIGVAFVIITGGIDLSIGSLVGLSGCLLVLFLNQHYVATDIQVTVQDIQKAMLRDGRAAVQIAIDPREAVPKPDDSFRFKDVRGREVVGTVYQTQMDGQRMLVTLREPSLQIAPQTVMKWSRFEHRSLPLVIAMVMGFSMLIGLVHGILITKFRLQPFVVTLCGLLIYRGLARVLSRDQPLGLGNTLEGVKQWFRGNGFSIPVPGVRWISEGNWSPYLWNNAAKAYARNEEGRAIALDFWQWIAVPIPGILLVVLAVVAWLLLTRTLFGRYLLALGNNPQAAKFSGIATDRMVIAAYVICSAMAGLSGILFTFDLNSVEPSSTGNVYELYAIAAAVLGGCSLRGGLGSIVGVVVGTAVMRALYLSIEALSIPKPYEFVIIGLALLIAVLADELILRLVQARKMRAQSKMA